MGFLSVTLLSDDENKFGRVFSAVHVIEVNNFVRTSVAVHEEKHATAEALMISTKELP